MRRKRKIVSILLAFCLTFSFLASALAAVPFTTTDGVNVRSGPSTEHPAVTVIKPNTKVEVLEHDPAGWSRVQVSGYKGFIRSDFLTIHSDSANTKFTTTEVVNLRDGASTNDKILTKVNPGSKVEMLKHTPAGWSWVRANGKEGYIRSDFLTIPELAPVSSSTDSNTTNQPILTLKTTGVVNLRAGATTDERIIKKVSAYADVEVLEQNSNGWSKVIVDGSEGYIRSDLLSEGVSSASSVSSSGSGEVELLKFSQVSPHMPTGVPFSVLDLKTGISYKLVCFSKGLHADVDTATVEDTQTLKKTYDGTWSWKARPVWVYIGDRIFAASMTGMPHAGTAIPGNGAGGQFCLHFLETVTNNKRYQADLRAEIAEAYAWASR